MRGSCSILVFAHFPLPPATVASGGRLNKGENLCTPANTGFDAAGLEALACASR